MGRQNYGGSRQSGWGNGGGGGGGNWGSAQQRGGGWGGAQQRGGSGGWGSAQQRGGGGGGGRDGGFGRQPQQGGFGGGGRQQQGGGGSWRDVVRNDRSVGERPRWALSSYGHEREASNDLVGDVSPEEVRWANMAAAAAGASGQQLAAEFKAAENAWVDLFKAVQAAPRPPSKGGPPLPPPSATISGLTWLAAPGAVGPPGPALADSGFISMQQQQQQTAGATQFGQAASPFVQPPAGSFGQPAMSSAGFGQPAPAFGQQTQQPQAVTGFGMQTASGFGAAVAGGNAGFGGAFGATGGSKPMFGQHQQQQTPAIFDGAAAAAGGGFGSSTPSGRGGVGAQFGAGAAEAFGSSRMAFGDNPTGNSPFRSAGMGFGQVGMSGVVAGMQDVAAAADDPDAVVWRAPAFEKGRIPEHAPPPVFCT